MTEEKFDSLFANLMQNPKFKKEYDAMVPEFDAARAEITKVAYSGGKMPPLTDAQIKEIEDAASRPIVYDNDCPKLTEEQLKQFRRVHGEKRKEAVV